MNKKTCLIYSMFIIFFFVLNACGQNRKVNYTEQLWSELDLFGRISKKWKWQCDFQYSRQSPYENINFLKYNEQLNIRSWIHYFPKPSIKLSAFIGYWYNFPIEDNVSQREYPEYRIALQCQFYKVFGLNTISNRFRTEFRDIKDRSAEFETVFRGRYMLKYQLLLSHKTYDKNSCYSILSNEIFINGGSAVTGNKSFDQNRFFIWFGYNLTNDIAIESGYYNQFSYHAHDTNFDSNNIWQVSLIFDNLTKLKH